MLYATVIGLSLAVAAASGVANAQAAAPAAGGAAQKCEVQIAGNDLMQFDLKEITVSRKCAKFTVKLVHTGKQSAKVMGHNWVLTKTSDVNGVASEGQAAGMAKSYIKDNDKRVLAHTKVIGGGESTSVTFDTALLKDKEAYTYFCSFPGHWAIMKGALKVAP